MYRTERTTRALSMSVNRLSDLSGNILLLLKQFKLAVMALAHRSQNNHTGFHFPKGPFMKFFQPEVPASVSRVIAGRRSLTWLGLTAAFLMIGLLASAFKGGSVVGAQASCPVLFTPDHIGVKANGLVLHFAISVTYFSEFP